MKYVVRYDLSSVVVQEMFFSRRAKAKYRLAPQRRGFGAIDIRGITRMKEFQELWELYVNENGLFALHARDYHGRFKRCIGIIRVSKTGGIRFKDRRCALAVMMRNASKRTLSEEDMEI